MVELADVLVSTGEFARADGAVAAVTALAGGDARLAAYASFVRLRMQVAFATDLDADALQAEARRAIATFAAVADERGLAKTYGLLAQLAFLRCRIAEAETAAAEAIGHARLAGDDPTEGWGRGLLAQAAFWGLVPAADGIRRCRALLAQADGNRRAELAALEALAGLQAMAGEAEAALATAGRAVALADDLGANRLAALARQFAAATAMLAGEAVAIAGPTDMLAMRGDALLDLAAVALAAGRHDDAAAAAATALELHLAKGNLPGATRARAAAAAARQPTPSRTADA